MSSSLRADLDNYTIRVPVNSWAFAASGGSAEHITEWTNFFATQGYAQSAKLDFLVRLYCLSPRENDRYEPLCDILNGILDFADSNKSFPNLPPRPLGKIKFCRNVPNLIRSSNTREAYHSPHILVLSEDIYEKYNKVHEDERGVMQERYTLLEDLQNIDELKYAKSGKKTSEIRRIERSIQYAERKTEHIKARRDALESTLKAFRDRHGISADYGNHTYLTAGPVTKGIDWNEPLSAVEVKAQPLTKRLAALAKWKTLRGMRKLPSPTHMTPTAACDAKLSNLVPAQEFRPRSLMWLYSLQEPQQPTRRPSDQAGMVTSAPLKRCLSVSDASFGEDTWYDGSNKHKRLRGEHLDSNGMSTEENGKKCVKEQAANYATELLASTNDIRSHCICITFNCQEVQFWYYDASGILKTEKLDWFEEFNKFAAIIVALGSLDLSGWGIAHIPALTPLKSSSPTAISPSPPGYTLTMNHPEYQSVTVTVGRQVFSQYSLMGRRTLVYDVTTNPRISDRDLVLKVSWQVCTRLSEAHILKQAKANGVKHLPELHMWTESENEYHLSQGIRGKLFPDNKKPDGKVAYEDRSLRFMVFTKYEPITLIISPSNMDYIFTQLIECLEKLRRALILHRDLSITNLMHDPTLLVDGKPHLILNDFDLATFINRDGSRAYERSSSPTGTLPFMACDILKNPEKPHYLRHDLESAVYMAWWIAINYPFDANGQPQKKKDILLRWEKGTFDSISKFKHSFLTNTKKHKEFLLAVSPDFKKYGTWLAAFRNIFTDGYAAQSNAGKKDAYKDGEMLMKQESGHNAEESLEQLRLQPILKMKEDETMFGFVTALTIKAALEKERNKLELLMEDFVVE